CEIQFVRWFQREGLFARFQRVASVGKRHDRGKYSPVGQSRDARDGIEIVGALEFQFDARREGLGNQFAGWLVCRIDQLNKELRIVERDCQRSRAVWEQVARLQYERLHHAEASCKVRHVRRGLLKIPDVIARELHI